MTIYNTKHPKIRGFELVKDAPCDTLLPKRGSEHSAGYDMYLPKDLYIAPMETSEAIPLNVKAYMPKDEFLMILPRSSIGIKKGLMLCNTCGVIDSDYYSNPTNDGNIMVRFQNLRSCSQELKKGERICQAIFVKYGIADDDCTKTKRVGGTGSTGE